MQKLINALRANPSDKAIVAKIEKNAAKHPFSLCIIDVADLKFLASLGVKV